jgi:hypothetical protein
MGRRRAVTALVGATAGAVVLAGCSGSGSSDADDATTPADSAPTTLEDGTTAPGTELELGKTATVRYTANPKHDSLIELTVTAVKRGKTKDLKDFDLTGAAQKSSVYYVRASVKNVGDGDLSGQPLTLYGKVSDDLVVPPVEFGSTFSRCDHDPLPKNFKKVKKVKKSGKAKSAKSVKVCLVILAPRKGRIKAVQWRPADNSDPISWLTR